MSLPFSKHRRRAFACFVGSLSDSLVAPRVRKRGIDWKRQELTSLHRQSLLTHHSEGAEGGLGLGREEGERKKKGRRSCELTTFSVFFPLLSNEEKRKSRSRSSVFLVELSSSFLLGS